MTGARTGRAAWPLALVAVLVAVAGCGGGSHKSDVSSSSASASASQTTASHTKSKPKPKPKSTGPTVVTELVLGKGGKKLAPSIKAKPDTPVVLRTLVPGTNNSGKMTIKFTAAAGPAKTLTITASGKGHTSVATIHSRSGTPLTLVDLRYTCALPPSPSFCPAKDVSGDSHGYKLTFRAAHVPGISLAATVGPVSGPTPVVRTPTASTAPPYAPTEVVKAVTPPKPGTKKKPPSPSPTPPTSSATAKPGDVLLMSTHLKGKPVGPPQPVTITINQGPGNSLSVTAAVAGGQTSTATVTGAHGKKITLVTPRFGCTVPPQPTICPPSNVQARSHQYKLTFMASPYTRAIAISALIQGG